MDQPPKSADELREAELVKEATALRETLRKATEAADRLSTTEPASPAPVVEKVVETIRPTKPVQVETTPKAVLTEPVPPPTPAREPEVETFKPSGIILDQYGKPYGDAQITNKKFNAEKINIDRKVKKESPLHISELKALKEKVRNLNEKYTSTTQREEKALLYSQLEKAQREYRALEEKFDTEPQFTERDRKIAKLQELRGVVRNLNERYISEPQREQKALLYSQLEKAQREYRAIEEEIDKTSTKKAQTKNITESVIPTTTQTTPTTSETTPPSAPTTQATETTPATTGGSEVPNGVSPEVVEVATVREEIAALPKEDREKLGVGLNNIGFVIEKKKNDYFAKTFDWISKKGDQKGTIARFTRGLRDSFKKDADMAKKKILAVNSKEAGKITKISNVAYLAKNFLRPMRLIMDATGMSPAGAQRLIMAGGMISARVTGAMKEARLDNEEVLEQTRLDIEKAQEEAMRVYENAQKRIGPDGKVSADELKTAYLHEIPKDLQERFKNTTVAHGMMQGVLRKHLEFDINRLNKDIEKIEADEKLTPTKKKIKKEQLLRRWENRLTDYDRVLTLTGTVDGYAMAARYAEATSQNVVRAATLQTLYLSLDKLWDNLSHISGISTSEIHPHEASPEISHGSNQTIEMGPKEDVVGISADQTLAPLTHEAVAGADTPTLGPTITPENAPQLEFDEKLDVVHKGEGIEHVFRRQIEHDSALAEKLGYHGDPTDAKALHQFSGGAAHRLAIDEGYVDKTTGAEIRVGPANELAYKIKLEGDTIKVDEIKVHGGLQETHTKGDVFERNQKDAYEYGHKNIPKAPTVDASPDSGKINGLSEEYQQKVFDGAFKEKATLSNTEAGTHSTDVDEARKKVEELYDNKDHFEGTSKPGEVNIGDDVKESGEHGMHQYDRPRSMAEQQYERMNGRNNSYPFGGERPGNVTPYNNGNPFIRDEYGRMHPVNGRQMMGRGQFFSELSPQENLILQTNPSFVENPFRLSGQELMETYDAHKEIIAKIFSDNTERDWQMVKDLKAENFLTKELPGDKFSDYIHKLQNVTGLKPSGGVFRKSETVGHYIARALQKALADGNLKEIEESVVK